MADDNLFPSPIPSPDLIELEEVTLTEAEMKITDLLGWTHKFESIVSRSQTRRVRWLVLIVPFLVNLLAAPGGYDVMERIIDFLSITDFLLLAAASDTLLLPFFRPNSKIYKRFLSKISSKLIHNKRTCPLAPLSLTPRYFETLKTGKDLLREYRLFKVPQYRWKVDDSAIFSTSTIKLIEFHPNR